MKTKEVKSRVEDRKSGGKVAEQVAEQRSSKSHQDYWKARLFHPAFTREGVRVQLPEYAVRIQHAGRREEFNLHLANAVPAAAKARDIYVKIAGAGWDAALAEYKPKAEVKPKIATVGELIEAASKVATVSPRSLSSYTFALRRLASDLAGIPPPVAEREVRHRVDGLPGNPKLGPAPAEVREITKRFALRSAYRSPEFQAWRAKVDSVRLDKLTPERIARWRAERIASRTDPTEREQAKVSADSIVRCAKSLFGRKILPHVRKELTLPATLPLHGLSLGRSARRFRPDVGAQWLFDVAKAELCDGPDPQPEMWKAFCLCLLGGLRRGEADCLTWGQLNIENARIEVRRTEWFTPKSAESEREIDLDAGTVEIMRHFRRVGDDPTFVLKGGPARPNVKYPYFRADLARHCTWVRLTAWLRSKGLTSPKPVHQLRKLAGSLIHEAHGIEAARDFLGHADVTTTSGSYLSKRPRVSVSLSGSPMVASAGAGKAAG